MVNIIHFRCELVDWNRQWANVAGQKWSRKR